MKDIETEAFQTDDPVRLDELYTEYMQEAKRQKKDSKPMQEVSTSSVESNVKEPNMEVGQVVEEHEGVYAWDDVNNMELPMEAVKEARMEEMQYMKGKTFKVVKRVEAFEKTGKPPISTKWVDTDMSHGVGEMKVRSRWVARDFKTRGKGYREDLLCATPPLELLRFLISRQATTRSDGRERKNHVHRRLEGSSHSRNVEKMSMLSCQQKPRHRRTSAGSCSTGFMGAGRPAKLGRITTPRC